MRRKVSSGFALLIGLSLAIAACGDDDASTPPDGGAQDHDGGHHDDDTDLDSGDSADDAEVDDQGDAGRDSGAGDAAVQPDGGQDAGPVVDPTAPPTLNGCTSYVDRTEATANRALTWDFSIASDLARCIKVKVGQSVTLQGDLSEHPIDQLGGTSPNPFAGANDTKSTFTFTKAGAFGYYCILHMEMNGTVWVVD